MVMITDESLVVCERVSRCVGVVWCGVCTGETELVRLDYQLLLMVLAGAPVPFLLLPPPVPLQCEPFVWMP